VHETPSIWRANQKTAVVTVSTTKSLQSLVLDGGIWVDADTTNNRSRRTRDGSRPRTGIAA
jgi:hypothetical protein